MTEGQQKIDWSVFDFEGAERVKIEIGKKYDLGFCGIRPDTIEVIDKQQSAEGKIETKKKIPVIILDVDSYNGRLVKTELLVTSKKLVKTIKTYFEKDMLFKWVFQIDKQGEGFQVSYGMIPVSQKAAASPPSPSPSCTRIEAFL